MIITVDFESEFAEMPLVRTYSDAGLMIRQVETGDIYDEAVDIKPCRFTYEETDIPVDVDDDPEELPE